MKFFLLCSYTQPEAGEWCDLAEFVVGNKEEIEKGFEDAIITGEFPFIVKGEVNACAKSSYNITEG